MVWLWLYPLVLKNAVQAKFDGIADIAKSAPNGRKWLYMGFRQIGRKLAGKLCYYLLTLSRQCIIISLLIGKHLAQRGLR